MCEFKVGDVVRRTANYYHDTVRAGDIVTVTGIATTGFTVKDGFFVHDPSNYELVERKAALTPVNPPYVFKVGDKGQTNAGWGYEIVAEHNDRLVVVGTGANTSYMVDKSGHGLGCPVVLRAPKRILYGMEVVFSNTRHNAPRAKETRITLYTSDAHRKQDIAGMTGQGLWTIVRQWEEVEA